LSKLNQKYHIAILNVALPKTPGNSTARAMLRAIGNAEREFTRAKPIANNIANSAPKNIQARMAHTKYTIRDVRETIQFLVIGR
jgi:hypothetical protein